MSCAMSIKEIQGPQDCSNDRVWRPYNSWKYAGMRKWLSIRSTLRYPLQRTLFLVGGSSFTIGEILILGTITATCLYLSFAATPRNVKDTGLVPSILLGLVFATAARNSIFTFLLGVPFERALFWHKSFAILSVLTGAFPHGEFFSNEITNGWETLELSNMNLSGCILWTAMTLLIVTSPVRFFLFRTFLALHFVFLTTAVVFAVIHGAYIALIGVGLWVFDVLFRYGYSVAVANPRTARLTKVSTKVVKVALSADSSRFTIGQYVFLCIPKLGFFDWHPFSVCIDNEDSTQISFYVKASGDWTNRLCKFVDDNAGDITINILCEGPFGSPRLDVNGSTYNSFCLISGGIGVTPNAFAAQRLLEEKMVGRPIENVRFCWSVAAYQQFDFLRNNIESWSSHEGFQARLFCRKERDLELKPIQRVLQQRIDVIHELTEMRKGLETSETHATERQQKHVAVLYCGPKSLEKVVLAACSKCSTRHIKFHFQHEQFTF